jgi:ribosomal protein L7/L12
MSENSESENSDYTLLARVVELERKVEYLMQRLGAGEQISSITRMTPSSPVPPEIADLARLGQKIEAIKRYRELTGASLREAKEAIDAIE